MSAQLQALEQVYAAALAACLERRDEDSLSRAYELGRQALVDGLGILDIVALHHGALGRIAAAAGIEPLQAQAAANFLGEALSPYEMSFRGFREANEELERLNKALLRRNADIEAVNRELETFSYSVSHDLRAPLRSIDGFSRILQEDYQAVLDDEGRKWLGFIRESTQQMGQLIEDLLSLARLTHTALQRSHVDLSALARRIAGRLQTSAPERQVEFRIAEAMQVEADGGLLTVVLENLLGNAWKFTSRRERARIEFARAEDQGRVVYYVRDNGAGFDPNYAAKLFGVFQRLHSTTEFEGTGIGLATVQRIIHRHAGRVWADGKPDAGATFFFTLGSDD